MEKGLARSSSPDELMEMKKAKPRMMALRKRSDEEELGAAMSDGASDSPPEFVEMKKNEVEERELNDELENLMLEEADGMMMQSNTAELKGAMMPRAEAAEDQDDEMAELEKLMAEDSGSAVAKPTPPPAVPAEETKVEAPKAAPIVKKKKAAPARPTKVKPAFSTFIGGATSDGFWPSSESATFLACVEGQDINDAKVREAVGQMSLAGGADSETVYLTLLAVFILEEIYGDNEDEW